MSKEGNPFDLEDRFSDEMVPQLTNHPFTIPIVIGNLTYNEFSSDILSANPCSTTDKTLYVSPIEAGGNHEQNHVT
jgi:hypothetical protein